MIYEFKVLKSFTNDEGNGHTRDILAGDVIEIDLRMSEYDAFKEDNKDLLERYFSEPPALTYGAPKQPDGRFMERLSRIQQKYPGAKNMFDNAKYRPKREW